MTAALAVGRPGAAPALLPAALLRSLARSVTRWTTRVLLLVAVLAFAVLAVGPHVLGYRTMTMLTGSMAPQIEPGDVVVSTPLDVHDVTAGMVLSYHIPVDDHRVVTHRVVSVEHDADGRVTVRTRGDANDAVDPWTATLRGDTAYRVRAVLPGLGHAVQLLRTPALSGALVYGAPALLAGVLIAGVWRRPARTQEDAA